MPEYKFNNAQHITSDLLLLQEFLYNNYPETADKIISTLTKRIEQLLSFPYMYPNYEGKKTYHNMVVYNGVYNVIYKIDEENKTISVFGIYYYAQEINPDLLKEMLLYI